MSTLTMITCRLLCALLVFALCCCPSVCGKDANKDGKDRSEEGSYPTKSTPEKPSQETELPSTNSPLPEAKKENKGTKPVENTSLHTSHTRGTIKETAEPQSNLNNTQEKGDGKSTEERTEKTNTDNANEQNEKPNAMNTTTTTTTTRAPSRLREIDGSFSSSAWVCAPLLLAASALACTTLG
ncbi:putative mucin TcMUCII [Trypanosoma cruzi]|nr:mucin TcMUCII [Trypanosoma cruzi cruzi]RNF04356.1 putative mucin TcMUCII [Trypanosoma cruzi]